jgi:hypothetical protein
MQELVAMRPVLLGRIRRAAAASVIRALRFRVAPLPQASAAGDVLLQSGVRLAPIPYALARAIRSVGSPALRSTLMRLAARWAGYQRTPG